jgi:hypothetical protein
MVSYMLIAWATLSLFISFNTFRLATSAVHELQGYIGLLIGTVALVGVGIIEAIKKNGKSQSSVG